MSVKTESVSKNQRSKMSKIISEDRSQGFELVWKRPEGPPRVWCSFEGRKKLADGTLPKFIIQEIPEEMFEDILDHMVDYCFTDEPTCSNAGLPNDPLGKQEMRLVAKCWMRQGISIVVLQVNNDPTIKPLIVGANILYAITSEDHAMANHIEQIKSKILKKIFRVPMDLIHDVNVLETYKVDKYLASFGLSVLPSFRGHGLGHKMLALREEIGRVYELSVTATVFSAIESQTLAHRTGFELLAQTKFTELLDYEGKLAYPGIPVEYIKVMGRRLD